MSFLSKLLIEDQEFTILESDYEIEQGANENGMPSTRSRGGIIRLTLEGDSRLNFFEWVVSQQTIKSGEIVFYKRDNLSSFRTLTFVDAFCIDFKDIFNHQDGEPLKTELIFSAKEISMRGTTFTNNWPLQASN